MKNKTIAVLAFLAMIMSSCVGNDTVVSQPNITFKFTHNWDGTNVTNADFNDLKFMNANGETVSIERLRYIISRIVFTSDTRGTIPFNGYFLADVNTGNLTFIVRNALPLGIYRLSFTFGLNANDNQNGIYQDLNSASWNVPTQLGGGYHYMQLDGKYTSTTSTNPSNFNYHAIRAVNNTDPNNLVFQNTFFNVNLGSVTISNNATIEIKMNIAEWFKNPNTWNLNTLNTVLMPNFNAQIMMSQNGKNVFSLGDVTQ